MPKFSKSSLNQLETCDPRLQAIMHEAIKYFDFTVLEGHRNKEDQNRAFRNGKSKLPWPKGNHNSYPSRAVDIAPYPIDWNYTPDAIARFAFMHGIIYRIATEMGIKIRFGHDWNRNMDPRDDDFEDWPHVELDEP